MLIKILLKKWGGCNKKGARMKIQPRINPISYEKPGVRHGY
jgi:hypothetical protein